MAKTRRASKPQGHPVAAKCPTGIHGLDEITLGGLPKGHPTLVCGSAGCGKTLLGIEFLVRGALQYNEPGVCLCFEETAEELTQNVASLGFDLADLIARKLVVIDHIFIERSQIEETGEYNLEGLFVRLGHAIDSVGAQRVLLDSLESLFSGLSNESILRAELRRLFRWLKEKGVTALATAERGEGTLTRHGLEEYISDCVILLDHRVENLIFTRRLRVVKYRGSFHGTNEYPFLIDQEGMSVLPVTSLGLEHRISEERVSTGIVELDGMVGGKGYFRGSTILVSGTAGTGKTSVAAHFLEAACRRGERCLCCSLEESPSQLLRNMRSIGIDLEPWAAKGLLEFYSARPTAYGLELHLVNMHKAVTKLKPQVLVVDPVTSLAGAGTQLTAATMLLRLIDFLKESQITTLLTALAPGGGEQEISETGISSLIDTWLALRNIEVEGQRYRGVYILKSRGMAHSNEIRQLELTDHGVRIHEAPTYVRRASVIQKGVRK